MSHHAKGTRAGDADPSQNVTGNFSGRRSKIIANSSQARSDGAAIRAELIGSDCCSAFDVTVNSSSPVLALCRRLIRAGHDPTAPLEAYRGTILCLRIRNIGEAACLEPSARGVGFVRRPGVRGGSPVAQKGPALTAGQQRDGAAS
jgi:hypothetical protein